MGAGSNVVGTFVHADDKASEWVYFGTRGGAQVDQGSRECSQPGIYAAHFNTRTGQLSPPVQTNT